MILWVDIQHELIHYANISVVDTPLIIGVLIISLGISDYKFKMWMYTYEYVIIGRVKLE